MEVNRFLCFKKKKILKLKPCLLGDWGMPGSGVCVRRGREVQRLVPNTSSGTHSWMQRLLGAVGSFAGRVSTTTGLGEPSRQKVRVGSLSSCSSWSEPRAHTCTPCFQKAWSRPPTIAGRKAVPVTLGFHLSLQPGPRTPELSFRHIPTASTASVMGISGVRSPRTGAPSGVTSFRDPRRRQRRYFKSSKRA